MPSVHSRRPGWIAPRSAMWWYVRNMLHPRAGRKGGRGGALWRGSRPISSSVVRETFHHSLRTYAQFACGRARTSRHPKPAHAPLPRCTCFNSSLDVYSCLDVCPAQTELGTPSDCMVRCSAGSRVAFQCLVPRVPQSTGSGSGTGRLRTSCCSMQYHGFWHAVKCATCPAQCRWQPATLHADARMLNPFVAWQRR